MLHHPSNRNDNERVRDGRRRHGCQIRALTVYLCAMLVFGLGMAGTAHSQVIAAGDAGKLIISAGGTASGEYVQYGERQLVGVTAFADFDSRSPFGVEAEGRWLEWNQKANVHVETYSLGPRFHKNFGNLVPYAKGMLGYGNFNFPYNLATGRYLMITAGGGLDLHVTKRIYFRAVDVEYQNWPQFTYGAMSTLSVSSGIRVRVF